MTARQPPLVDVCWAVTSFTATLPAVDEAGASYAMDEQHESWIRDAVPLARLATAAFRQQFQSAPIVLGYDDADDRLVLIYGREALGDPARADQLDQQILVLIYNGQRGELDDLLAACRELKCHCDYVEGGDPLMLPATGQRRRVDTGPSPPSPSPPRRGRRTRRSDDGA